jgi:hypothetical protein
MLAGIVSLIAVLEAGSGPEIVTVPPATRWSGVGALASRLGAVTGSSVSAQANAEVGGLQNTHHELGVRHLRPTCRVDPDRWPDYGLP